MALEFRLRVPEMYISYKEKCARGEIKIGQYWIYQKSNRMGKRILNFPVKQGFNHPSKWEYVFKGLRYFVDNYESDNIRSIAMPTLGARLGKLNDEAVLEVMQADLGDLPIEIEIYQNRAQDKFTNWVKGQIDKMAISEISEELGLRTPQSERIKACVSKAILLSDLVVFDKMSVNMVQRLYDFGFKRMTNSKLQNFVEARVS